MQSPNLAYLFVLVAMGMAGGVEAKEKPRTSGKAASASTTATTASKSAPRFWLKSLLDETGLPAEETDGWFSLNVNESSVPVPLKVRAEEGVQPGEYNLRVWNALLYADEALAKDPAMERALVVLSRQFTGRVTARTVSGQFVLVYESSGPQSDLTSQQFRSFLSAEAKATREAVRLLQQELAKKQSDPQG